MKNIDLKKLGFVPVTTIVSGMKNIGHQSVMDYILSKVQSGSISRERASHLIECVRNGNSLSKCEIDKKISCNQ